MRNLHLVNGTDYIWTTSEDRAKEVYVTEVMEEANTVELIPADKHVYIQEPDGGGEGIWWFNLHPGWEVIEEHTVAEYFSRYYGDDDVIVYSTEW